jgi:hypothetical protein
MNMREDTKAEKKLKLETLKSQQYLAQLMQEK